MRRHSTSCTRTSKLRRVVDSRCLPIRPRASGLRNYRSCELPHLFCVLSLQHCPCACKATKSPCDTHRLVVLFSFHQKAYGMTCCLSSFSASGIEGFHAQSNSARLESTRDLNTSQSLEHHHERRYTVTTVTIPLSLIRNNSPESADTCTAGWAPRMTNTTISRYRTRSLFNEKPIKPQTISPHHS